MWGCFTLKNRKIKGKLIPIKKTDILTNRLTYRLFVYYVCLSTVKEIQNQEYYTQSERGTVSTIRMVCGHSYSDQKCDVLYMIS
jgi:hypothetical protein